MDGLPAQADEARPQRGEAGRQAHSVRGFLSGAVRKRKGLAVLSECDGEGTRRYRIDQGQEA
ncbi:MAG: DUF3489 domain-containing protein [Alphaproteobacteria bacterium]|nr:DUF3489 domain-containing protein [Alphaproteobacteria bacterium]